SKRPGSPPGKVRHAPPSWRIDPLCRRRVYRRGVSQTPGSSATRLLGGTDIGGPRTTGPGATEAGRATSAGTLVHTGILPDDHLSQKQRVVMLKPAIDGPSSDPDRLTVVKTVDVAASKRQRVFPSINAKLLNLQGNLDRVSTGDPLSPRQFPFSHKSALFSNT